MILLAIDPSTKAIGWALFENGKFNSRYERSWGTIAPVGATAEKRVGSAYVQMSVLLGCMWPKLDVLAIEIPYVHKNPSTSLVLAELVGGLIALTKHRYYAMRVERVRPAEWQHSALRGVKRTTKRKDRKGMSIATAKALCGEMVSEDEADAVCLGHFISSKLLREERAA